MKDPRKSVDRKIRRQTFKYTLLDDNLYRRTMNGLFLKCLDSDQVRIAMREVHEGIGGTHQSKRKIKWLLKRVSLIASCIIKGVKHIKSW